MSFPAKRMFSSRPRHCVLETPSSIDSGVMRGNMGRNSRAA